MATTPEKIYGSTAQPYDSGNNLSWNFIEQTGAGDNTFAFQDVTLDANVTTIHGSGDKIFMENNFNPDIKIKQVGKFVYITEGLSTLKIELQSLSANKTTGAVSLELVYLNGDVTISNKPGSKTLKLWGVDDNGKAVSQTLTGTAKAIKANINPIANQEALDFFTIPVPPVPPTPVTFNLTTSVDTFVGVGDSADTINAFPDSLINGYNNNTLTAYDNIDGGNGHDTFNIYTATYSAFPDSYNTLMPSTVSVKNVETINIYNDKNSGGFSQQTAFATNVNVDREIDASKFAGATSINQYALASNITHLLASTVAGFYNQTYLNDLNEGYGLIVEAADGVKTINVDLGNITGHVPSDAAGFGGQVEAGTMHFFGGPLDNALNTVNITGTLGLSDLNKQQYMAFTVDTGLNESKLTFTTSVNAELDVYSHGTLGLTTIDASRSTGGISYTDTNPNGQSLESVSTLLTGSGNDFVKLTTSTSATIDALVNTNAGNDTVQIATTGIGRTNVLTGAGNDTVNIVVPRIAGTSGILTVNLAEGDDKFGLGDSQNSEVNGGEDVKALDVIDGGAGKDTLSLEGIGSANAASFINFEVADVNSLETARLGLDMSLLKGITSVVASGKLNDDSKLTNLGAGVNFTSYVDMGSHYELTLAQAVAGALTVSLDVDNAVANASSSSEMVIDATNATSLNAVFDSSSLFSPVGNLQTETIDLTGDLATSLAIVSGGTSADNWMNYTYGVDNLDKGLLTTVTVTGTQNLHLDLVSTHVRSHSGHATDHSSITLIDASALTGNLSADLQDLKAGGTVKLGAGDDIVTANVVHSTSNSLVLADERSVVGFEKASLGTLTVQNGFDVLHFSDTASQAANGVSPGEYVLDKGLLTFSGVGPGNMDQALTIAEDALAGGPDGAALVFQYGSNSYVLEQNSVGGETLIQLTGLTGLHGLNVTADGDAFVF